MQRLEFSDAVPPIYASLGFKVIRVCQLYTNRYNLLNPNICVHQEV